MHTAIILFFGNLFSSDMLIIVFVALILFGGEKLPEIARGLGKGIRDFKDASEGVKREINNQINSYEEKQQEKRMEELIAENHRTDNKQLGDGNQAVENTVPYSENVFIEDKHANVETSTNIDALVEDKSVVATPVKKPRAKKVKNTD